ncbi:hypothetical protein V6N13_105645 [Hibiscus sabdariffa]
MSKRLKKRERLMPDKDRDEESPVQGMSVHEQNVGAVHEQNVGAVHEHQIMACATGERGPRCDVDRHVLHMLL